MYMYVQIAREIYRRRIFHRIEIFEICAVNVFAFKNTPLYINAP